MFLDEGLGLRVITLTRFNVPIDNIRRYCEALPPANAYVIMTLNNECRRQERLFKRGEGDRRATILTKKGPAMRAGLNCLLDIMNGRGIPILEIDAEHSLEENAACVDNFVQELASAEKQRPK